MEGVMLAMELCSNPCFFLTRAIVKQLQRSHGHVCCTTSPVAAVPPLRLLRACHINGDSIETCVHKPCDATCCWLIHRDPCDAVIQSLHTWVI